MNKPSATELLDHMSEASMRGMRNRIAHGYYDIDLDIVCETATASLPLLAAQLAAGESPEST